MDGRIRFVDCAAITHVEAEANYVRVHTGGFGGWDLWRSRWRADGSYGPAENLGAALNTAYWEFNPTVTADGNRLLFASIDRPDGFGSGDLYVAERPRGGRARLGVAPRTGRRTDS
ncbi:hypothetical protein [Cystobacter fuscus]|uniref:hypothetical protein n=1 Tax=Cystobacter fuscus TaxID=43 RepID=UPI0037C07C68